MCTLDSQCTTASSILTLFLTDSHCVIENTNVFCCEIELLLILQPYNRHSFFIFNVFSQFSDNLRQNIIILL